MEPDYSSHLTAAEQELAKVYPCMCDRKVSQAVIHALKACEEIGRFITWVVTNKAK